MEKPKRISFSKKLIDRVGNPLDWSTVDKCLVIICFWMLIAPLASLFFHHFINYPAKVPFFDPVVMKKVIPIGWGFGVVWSILLVVGLKLRHHRSENRTFVYVTVVLWWAEEAIAAICPGPLTTPGVDRFLFPNQSGNRRVRFYALTPNRTCFQKDQKSH